MPGQSRILLNQTSSGSAARRGINRNTDSYDHTLEDNLGYNDHSLPPQDDLNSSSYVYNNSVDSPPIMEPASSESETHDEVDSKSSDKPLLEVPASPPTKDKKNNRSRPTPLSGNWHSKSREPGLDPRKVELSHLRASVVIQVADFDCEDADFHVLTNSDLPAFLLKPRPTFAKVRWIHCNGLDWNVIKALALKYDLHPLSLEDMLNHGTSSTRSKCDYYRQHLFVSAVMHKSLASSSFEDNIELDSPPSNHHLREQLGFHSRALEEESIGPPSYSEENVARQQRAEVEEVFGGVLKEAFSGVEKNKEDVRVLSSNTAGLFKYSDTVHSVKNASKRTASRSSHEASKWTVAALTKDVKINIYVEQLSIFLLRDGTIISFTQDPGYHARFSSIFNRIRAPESLIREMEDNSFVLQALLDVGADHLLEIIDAFRNEITTLEASVLAHPDMSDVRHLHVLSAQLLLLKSNVTPFQQLLHNLRTQDDAKAAASIKPSFVRSSSSMTNNGKTAGFVSHEAKIYFSDVLDHTESVLASLDLFSSLTENLIAFTFNNLSYSSNAYMQALSVLSVIFLPLTFLSGYFGMNFTSFSDLENGLGFFWTIAIPTTAFTTIVFSWTYFVEMYKAIGRRSIGIYHSYLWNKQEKEMELVGKQS